MRIMLGLLFVLLLFIPLVFSATCTDSDKGPVEMNDVAAYVTTPGTAQDQFGTRKDVCVESELGRKSVEEGGWLREYYCFGAIP